MADESELVKLSKNLALAEEWAKSLGNGVTRKWGVLPDGTKIPSLFIQHGIFVIICTEQRGSLVLLAIVEIPPESREKIRHLPDQEQNKLIAALKVALMQDGRMGFLSSRGSTRCSLKCRSISLRKPFALRETTPRPSTGSLMQFRRWPPEYSDRRWCSPLSNCDR